MIRQITAIHTPLVCVSCAAILLSGCASFRPKIAQPENFDGTFSNAAGNLKQTHRALSRRLSSQELIGGLTNLSTFAGFGGAGVSAVFKGSRDLILGFVSLGSASSVINGLYANPAQASVYSNGLDAVVCIETAFAPLVSAQSSLSVSLSDLSLAQKDVGDYLKDNAKHPPESQRATAVSAVEKAETVMTQAHTWQAMLNSKAGPALESALTGVITTINNQLRTVVPDAAAFARAGSGLQNIIANPTAQPKAPEQQLQTKELEGPPDPDLAARLARLNSAIDGANTVISVPVESTAVSCKVADATPVAPITIVVPSGSPDITIAPGGSASYQISGGTQPYMSIQWSPSSPSCFTASILSPNTLQISGKASCTTDNGKDFTFQVYDVLGHSLAKPMTLKVSSGT